MYKFIWAVAQDLAHNLARDFDIDGPDYARRAWDICLQLGLFPQHPEPLETMQECARAQRIKFAFIVIGRMETEIEHMMMNTMCPPKVRVEQSVLARQLDKVREGRELFLEWDEQKERVIVEAIRKERLLMKEAEMLSVDEEMHEMGEAMHECPL